MYIAIKPSNREQLTATEKATVVSYLTDRSVLGIEPVIVNADNYYITAAITVTYNPNLTTITSGQLKASTISTVTTYSDDKLERFDSKLRRSKLEEKIADISAAIVGVNSSYVMYKRFTPALATNTTLEANFNNALYVSDNHERHDDHIPAVYTSAFTKDGRTQYIKDDGLGVLFMYYLDTSGNEVITDSSIGTVNYTTGAVQIINLNVDSYSTYVKIFAKPADSGSIMSSQNQLFQIEADDVTVTMQTGT